MLEKKHSLSVQGHETPAWVITSSEEKSHMTMVAVTKDIRMKQDLFSPL